MACDRYQGLSLKKNNNKKGNVLQIDIVICLKKKSKK